MNTNLNAIVLKMNKMFFVLSVIKIIYASDKNIHTYIYLAKKKKRMFNKL